MKTKLDRIKTFSDFPPAYLLLFLVSCVFAVMWGFLVVYGYGLAIVDLPSIAPLATLNWFVVLLQFLFSVLILVGILKFAFLRIDFHFYKEHTNETIDFLRKKLAENNLLDEEEGAD